MLDIEEKSSNEVKVQDINEEQRLMLNVGMAYASGNIEAVMKATTEYNAFQNRHIEKLKNDNKALAEGILEWRDRKNLTLELGNLHLSQEYNSARCGMNYIRIFSISMEFV